MSGRQSSENKPYFDDEREDAAIMSREWKEPNATRQNPNDLSWDDLPQENAPPFSYEEDEVATISNPPAMPPEDFAMDESLEPEPEPFITRSEALRNFGQQISPILVPLLFGGLTFLFILPLARSGHFYLHAERLWPVALVLIALAVLQGMLLYYAGSNNVYWSLGIVGGFFLFLLVGCFAVFGPLPTAILFVVLLIVSAVAARLYMRPIPEGSVGIVYSFGKYSRTLFPGLNFLLPWEWVDSHLHTRERQWTCPEQTVQVSRDEDVHIKATISYQLMPEDAYLAVTQVENWEESLHDMFKACLQSVCNELTPDDFIAWPQRSRSSQSPNMILNNPVAEEEAHWEHINTILFQRMRDRVALWGVVINWVSIRDITLTPRSPMPYETNPVLMSDGLPAGTGMGTASAPTPPPQAQASSQRMGAGTAGRLETPPPLKSTPAVAPVIIKAPEATPASSAAAQAKSAKEDALKKAYEQVRAGKITSPETIRSIAARFQAIANDPEANKNASFDAAAAAEVLYKRAQLHEERALMAAGYPEDDTPTQVDWSSPRRPNDDNYTAGG